MEQFYKNKSVLVTGGCGFIGSHLVTALVQAGANVTVMDNLSSGSLDHIAHIQDKVTFIEADIRDSNACRALTKDKKVVFHLAAFISVPQSVELPITCHEVNVDGTVNLLESARNNNVERFVFSSSSAVYGPSDLVCTETSPCNPISPYGFSKLIGELYCRQYAHSYGMNTVMMRYFNVYGPRQNPHAPYAAVVAKFSYQMINNLPITVFGDGHQTRDFIPAADVAHANMLLGMYADQKEVRGQAYNIATNKSISILELIEQLKEQYPAYTSDIVFDAPRPGDVRHTQSDCSKYFDVLSEYKNSIAIPKTGTYKQAVQ